MLHQYLYPDSGHSAIGASTSNGGTITTYYDIGFGTIISSGTGIYIEGPVLEYFNGTQPYLYMTGHSVTLESYNGWTVTSGAIVF